MNRIYNNCLFLQFTSFNAFLGIQSKSIFIFLLEIKLENISYDMLDAVKHSLSAFTKKTHVFVYNFIPNIFQTQKILNLFQLSKKL